MLKHLITTTKDGQEVYANLIKAPLNTKVSRAPHLLTLVKEIVADRDLTEPALLIEQDMKRTVGYSDYLQTQETDTIFYARQVKALGYTRFVKHRKTDATTFVTVALQQDTSGDYEVTDVLIGKRAPLLPDEEGATRASEEYWRNHAVVYNGQPIVASSLTKDCPY